MRSGNSFTGVFRRQRRVVRNWGCFDSRNTEPEVQGLLGDQGHLKVRPCTRLHFNNKVRCGGTIGGGGRSLGRVKRQCARRRRGLSRANP